MLIIVIGCGKVGSRFAMMMSQEGHDVVIVDSESSSFAALDPSFNGITITGIPIDEDVLKQAGIEEAGALAALTPDDNINIMVCQVAKEIFKVPKVLARIYNPAREEVFHHFGLDTICPTNITIDVIRSIILGETGISRHSIGSNLFTFRRIALKKSDIGKKIGQISSDYKDSHIFGVLRNHSIMFANDDMVLEQDDALVLADKVD